MGSPLPLCLASLLLLSGVIKSAGAAEPLFPVRNEATAADITTDGESAQIQLNAQFTYFGKQYSQLFLGMDGYLSFEHLSPDSVNPSQNKDIIAPLWADVDPGISGKITSDQATSGELLEAATTDMNLMFPGLNFKASWVFIGTWENVEFEPGTGEVTFQVVLVSDDESDLSFVLINYGDISNDIETWMAGYQTVNNMHEFIIQATKTSLLPQTTNVGIPGRWVFRVDGGDATCDKLSCTKSEVCIQRTGIYGCGCAEETEGTNPEPYDATKFCASSSGSISLSRCQLFEDGFSPEFLHLNDPSCGGEVQNDRVVFAFDNDENLCSTTLQRNQTHFIYENSVQATFSGGQWNMVSRDRNLKITFSCVYPLIESISFPMFIHASKSFVSKVLPGTEGTYQIRMESYPDGSFTAPYSGNVTLEVNQQMFVAVEVDGVDSRQFSTVLDSCWATPDSNMDNIARWDLVTDECPATTDGTVQVLQNGETTSSHFSFRMFTFTGFPDSIFLHCQVHLCLRESAQCVQPCDDDDEDEPERRRRRSVDFHDSAAISMGLL